jgi:hypothetical protein
MTTRVILPSSIPDCRRDNLIAAVVATADHR